MYVMYLLDTYSSGWIFLTNGILECFAISYVYGKDINTLPLDSSKRLCLRCSYSRISQLWLNPMWSLTYTKRQASAEAAASSNVGQWWRLGMDLGPIFKHHHWPALDDTSAAADAATTADAWRSVWVHLKDFVDTDCKYNG